MRPKKLCLLILLLIIQFQIFGQTWKHVKTIPFPSLITAQSIDPEGRIYIGTANGSIHRLDATKSLLELYSDINNFPVTTINAWNKFKVFTFVQNEQLFYFLDRFNTTPQLYQISDYTQEIVSIATPGLDNSIWILSSGFNELNKLNLQNRQELISNPLNVRIDHPTCMRVFQNLLIIADEKNGIFFFDQFGNYLSKIDDGVLHFQIDGENLIYLKDHEIFSRKLKNTDQTEKIKVPKRDFNKVLRFKNQYYFIGDQLIDIYSLEP